MGVGSALMAASFFCQSENGAVWAHRLSSESGTARQDDVEGGMLLSNAWKSPVSYYISYHC